MRNVNRFYLVSSFGGVFTFFGKLFIGVLTAFMGWFMLTEWDDVKDSIYSPILPTIACFLIGYIFANMFLTVYDLASSAILQCFLIDEETSGGTGKNRPPELEDFIIRVKSNSK